MIKDGNYQQSSNLLRILLKIATFRTTNNRHSK